MRFILFVFLTCLLLPAHGAADEATVQIEPLSIGDLYPYFDRIRGFEFRRAPDNGPMLCQIGARSPFISQPGTVVQVPAGSHLTLHNKTSEIEFLTSPDATIRATGFLVIEMTLQRGTDHQIIHVGFATVPYFTHQMPSERHLQIFPWPEIKSSSDVTKAEKECADFETRTGKKP